MGARVGFIFLLELPLHRSHVIRCATASNIVAICRKLQARCLGAPARLAHLHYQEQHLFEKAAILSPQSVDNGHVPLANIAPMTRHLVVSGAPAVSVLVALVHELRNVSFRASAAWCTGV
jgi:hypothetical protein